LQLTLDLFRDLQYSLQPRLHMELGLVRLVHAGRLKSIEDILAGLASGAAPVAAAPPRAAVNAPAPTARLAAPAPAPVVAAAPPPPAPAPAASAFPENASLKAKIHAILTENGNKFSADAIEMAAVADSPGGVDITASKADIMTLKTDKTLAKVCEQALGRPVKVNFIAGDPGAAAQEDLPQKKKTLDGASSDAEQRARQHPEVQRYQELFPGSTIRNVRDLSDI
jgi:DNA polymerase-3 subunit gamma/tau